MYSHDKVSFDLLKILQSKFSQQVEFAVIFGSRARLEHQPQSDIDLLLIFKDDIPSSQVVDNFKNFFVQFQINNQLTPDTNYPAELITSSEIKKAIAGYGFVYSEQEERVEIPPISLNGWTPFNEYRQWLSACAGPSKLILGDPTSFEELKKSCLQTIVLLTLLQKPEDTFNKQHVISNLLEGGKEYLGFCHTDYTKQYLNNWVPQIVSELEMRGLVQVSFLDEYTLCRSKAVSSLNHLVSRTDFDLKSKFLGILNKESELEFFKQCLDIGVDFVASNHHRVLNFYPEKEIQSRLLEEVPHEGQTMSQIISEFRTKILDGSIKQSSPGYLAFPDSGNAISGLAASILESFTNQNLIAVAKSAPTGTFVEVQVVSWLRELVGFATQEKVPENALDVGGIMTTGGTLANVIGLLVARCKAFPNSRKQGLTKSRIKPVLLVAGDTIYHYSHVAAFWWLGLGEENIVKIDMGDEYRFDYKDLDAKLTKYNNGKTSQVVAVIAQAGDSRTTTIEDFEKIAKITNKHNVWLHVDACHGGILLFSKQLKGKMRGIDKADSISIDPHKGLGIPYASSAVLFRNPKDLRLISKSTDITIQKDSFDLGQITPFLGSRPFDSLKLWFFIKHLGTAGIERLVEYRFKLAGKWLELINSSKYFISLNHVELNSVVFSVSPKKLKQYHPNVFLDVATIKHVNQTLHDITYREGRICIHAFDIIDVTESVVVGKQKIRVLGVTMGNPYTSAADFPEYIAYLEKHIEGILKSL